MANTLKKIKGYVPIPVPDAHRYHQEICRGTGCAKPSKGKGSYSRKKKYTGGDY